MLLPRAGQRVPGDQAVSAGHGCSKRPGLPWAELKALLPCAQAWGGSAVRCRLGEVKLAWASAAWGETCTPSLFLLRYCEDFKNRGRTKRALTATPPQQIPGFGGGVPQLLAQRPPELRLGREALAAHPRRLLMPPRAAPLRAAGRMGPRGSPAAVASPPLRAGGPCT